MLGLKSNRIRKTDYSYDIFQYLSSENCNMHKLCRICLEIKKKSDLCLLSSQDTLLEIFTSFASVQIESEDNLPSSICIICRMKLIESYKFKMKCESSDSILKAFTNKDSVLKEELKEFNDHKPEDCKDIALQEYEVKIEYQECNQDLTTTDNNSSQAQTKLVKTTSNTKQYKSQQKSQITAAPDNSDALEFIFKCRLCKEVFCSEKDSKLHSILHSKGPPWVCKECQSNFKSRTLLRRHVYRHMEHKRYECSACKKRFAEAHALKRHIRVHTGVQPEKKYKCELCEKRFQDRCQLVSHTLKHRGTNPFICNVCGKGFRDKRLLASHQRTHSDEKPYSCDQCGQRFRHESSRVTHARTHSGERPYVCHVCGKAFIQNSNLTLHARTHTGEKPYECRFCRMKFSSTSTLRSHERTHSVEKPYACSVCDKRFTYSGLKTHLASHAGDAMKKFECSACPNKYYSAARLKYHERVHTGEKPFECANCGQKFSTKSLLRRHIKTEGRSKKKYQKKPVLEPIPIKKPNTQYIILQHIDGEPQYIQIHEEESALKHEMVVNEVVLDVIEDVPIEVSGELVLQSDGQAVS